MLPTLAGGFRVPWSFLLLTTIYKGWCGDGGYSWARAYFRRCLQGQEAGGKGGGLVDDGDQILRFSSLTIASWLG